MSAPFKGKASAAGGGGDGGTFDVPDEGTHPAVVVALVDLGTHERSYQGQEKTPMRRLFVVFELTEERNILVGNDFFVSFNEKAKLRGMAEKVLRRKFGEGEEIDYSKLLGKPCLVTVKHTVKGERTYANYSDATSAVKGMKPGKTVTVPEPFVWVLGEDDIDDVRLAKLPRIFGRLVRDEIGSSIERRGKVGAGGGVSSSTRPVVDPVADIPF